ncbi:hypothetical protein CEUSTIGMA_g3372.t1 [Chlamydomonas eustigma]|uniref:J domain-containing protein n=1 Tax=Chlamydomonas eustigma TaxID=1157962 RepID=A0A250WZ06_9CHLO|nr:hypothetical protein CEUSTIGMA_g3372.t1 [Chlamydomonas eustigma]|eukprot:GAX75929.1 hypothetical protein CEUSTIGMA_g3372.t1 [Chlamydomonas eustigma]
MPLSLLCTQLTHFIGSSSMYTGRKLSKFTSCSTQAELPPTPKEMSCWSCQHRFQQGGVVCSGCDKIQPLDTSLNYFEVLGMPNMQFDLDLEMLEKQYKRLQWQIHPDRLAARTPQEQDYSAQSVMHINVAYGVLRHPLSRANYILAQRGIINEVDSEGASISDLDFLNEVMDLRERVDETSDIAPLQSLLTANKEQQRQLIQRLSSALASPCGSSEAVTLAFQLTYVCKLEEAIVKKLPEL